MIYKLNTYKDDNIHTIPYLNKFITPKLIWGDVEERAALIWNDFILGEGNCGALLTGNAGTGKTLLAELVCNIAINNGLMVILLSEIKVNVKVIQFLSQLNNVVLLFDEYAKLVDFNDEKFLLNMMSSLSSKKLFLLTENHTNISQYILNRPGRIKYHFSYPKLEQSMFYDYVNHHINSSHRFYRDIIDLYNSCTTFSFDHLQTLVDEHISNKDIYIEDMLEYLNLHGLRKDYHIVLREYNIIDQNQQDVSSQFKVSSQDFNTSLKKALETNPYYLISVTITNITNNKFYMLPLKLANFKEIKNHIYIISDKVALDGTQYSLNCVFEETLGGTTMVNPGLGNIGNNNFNRYGYTVDDY